MTMMTAVTGSMEQLISIMVNPRSLAVAVSVMFATAHVSLAWIAQHVSAPSVATPFSTLARSAEVAARAKRKTKGTRLGEFLVRSAF